MAFEGKNPVKESLIFKNKGAAGVSNAPTDAIRVINRDGVLIAQDDGGVESILGAGAGGGTNYFTNGSFETSATEGVAASGAVSPTLAAETAAPLYDTQSSKVTTGAGTGIIDYNIGLIDNGVVDGQLSTLVSAHIKTDAAVADGEWTVGVYDTVLAAYVVQPEDLKSDSLTVFRTPFFPAFKTADRFQLRFEFTDTTAGRVLIVDKLGMTPDSNSGLVKFDQRTITVDDSVLNLSATGIGDTSGAHAYAFKDANEEYWFTFAFSQIVTSSSSNKTFTVDGVVWSGTTQAIYAEAQGNIVNRSDAINGNDFRIQSAGAHTLSDLSGTVKLASKPTWFDDNLDNNKVNLLTQSVISANARCAYQMPTGTTILNGTSGTGNAAPYLTELYAEGGLTYDSSTGEILFPASGKYDINLAYTNNAANQNNHRFLKTTSLTGTIIYGTTDNIPAIARPIRLSTVQELVKGTRYFLTISTADGGGTTSGDVTTSTLSISKLADFGAFEPVGFGLATTTQAGLLFDTVSDSVTLTSGTSSTTSLTLSDVSGTILNIVLARPGRIAYAFAATFFLSTGAAAGTTSFHNIKVDSTLLHGTRGLQNQLEVSVVDVDKPICISGLTGVLSAGAHTLVVQHAVASGVTLETQATSQLNLTFSAWSI